MVTPITPQELKEKRLNLPDFVIEAFNDLIEENFDGRSAVVYQEEVVRRLKDLVHVPEGVYTPDTIDRARRERLFKIGWLNVESLYEKQGWKVTFYKPDYTESGGEASFTFTAP